jgi:plastocyanin
MKRLIGAAVAALALVVSACGGDDGEEEARPPPPPSPATTAPAPPPSGEGTVLENPADAGGELEFQKDSLTAPAGRITLVMFNPSSEVHNISVEGEDVDEKRELVGKGETSRVTVVLEPGEYTFYSSVPLHRDGGMEGTLTRRALGAAPVEADRPAVDRLDPEMRLAPRIARERCADCVLRLRLDYVDDAVLVGERPAQDDEARIDEAVHEGRMRRPVRLLLERP